MPRKKTVLPSPEPPPPPGALDSLLYCMGVEQAGEARRKFDDLNLLTPARAFAWLGSLDRLPAGMGLEQFAPLFDRIMEA